MTDSILYLLHVKKGIWIAHCLSHDFVTEGLAKDEARGNLREALD